MKLIPKHIAVLERLTRAPIDKRADGWRTHQREIDELFEVYYIEGRYNRLHACDEWQLTDEGRAAYDEYLLESETE